MTGIFNQYLNFLKLIVSVLTRFSAFNFLLEAGLQLKLLLLFYFSSYNVVSMYNTLNLNTGNIYFADAKIYFWNMSKI